MPYTESGATAVPLADVHAGRARVRLWLRMSPALLFTVLGAIFAVSGLQGVDLIDDGYHVFHQHQFLLWGECPAPSAYLSHLAGGLWLSIADRMIWYRLGGAVIFAAIATVSLVILNRLYPSRRGLSLAAVMIVAVIVHSRVDTSAIHYGTVPGLLAMLFLYSLHASGAAGTAVVSRRWLFAAGFIVPMLVLAKFPQITIAALPAILWAQSRMAKSGKGTGGRHSIAAAIGVGAGAGVAIGLLAWMGHVHAYYEGLRETLAASRGSTGSHTLSGMIYIYVRRLVEQLLIMLALAPVTLALWRVFARRGHVVVCVSLSVAITYALFLVVCNSRDVFLVSAGSHFLAFLGVLTSMVGLYLGCSRKAAAFVPNQGLLVAAVWLGLVSVAGTNTGIHKAGYVLFLTGPYVLIAVTEWLAATGGRLQARSAAVGLLAPLAVIGLYQEYTNAPRTVIDRTQMRSAIDAGATFLSGMYETEAKAEELEYVGLCLRQHCAAEDLLLVQHGSLRHTLCDARPYTSEPLLMQLESARLRGVLEMARERHGRPPDAILLTPGFEGERRRIFDSLVSGHDYGRVCAIRGFELWILRDDG